MSLSFVSKAVLTANSDGTGFEETAIEGGETEGSSSVSGGGYAKPLFEQLRANKDQEDEERDEFQKSMMRGTLALDEEDCAHLDAVRKQRQERDNLIHREMQSELEAFRAAQQLKQIEEGMKDDDDDDDEEEKESSNTATDAAQQQPQKPAVPTRKFPTIIAKKKRKVVTAGTAAKASDTRSGEAKKAKQEILTKVTETKSTPAAGLGSLLAGYGSDSDSDWTIWIEAFGCCLALDGFEGYLSLRDLHLYFNFLIEWLIV